MNRKQRMKNRATSLELIYKLPPKYTCPECGEKSHHGHFVVGSLFQPGFWTCDKFYDPETGRRIVT